MDGIIKGIIRINKNVYNTTLPVRLGIWGIRKYIQI
jgi:hypothetical protein